MNNIDTWTLVAGKAETEAIGQTSFDTGSRMGLGRDADLIQ